MHFARPCVHTYRRLFFSRDSLHTRTKIVIRRIETTCLRSVIRLNLGAGRRLEGFEEGYKGPSPTIALRGDVIAIIQLLASILPSPWRAPATKATWKSSEVLLIIQRNRPLRGRHADEFRAFPKKKERERKKEIKPRRERSFHA